MERAWGGLCRSAALSHGHHTLGDATGPAPSVGRGGACTALLDEAPGGHERQPSINLIICDSQPIFALGLVQLLRSEAPEFEVAGIAASVDDLLEMTSRLRPDLVMLDARFGIEPARPLFSMSPPVKVILVASADHEMDLADALAAGVCAYLLKEQGISDIVQVLRLVLRDLLVVPAALARSTLHSGTEGLRALDAVERQILAHIAQGETNRDIARALNLSERTVRRRVIHVYDKLHVSDRVDAALYAERHGLRAPTV
ncbi:MAG: two component transcriptional regulator, LuxR family [Actinobacteria bacterium]|nr:two component transcriptional regulator, LuxR family [Actinomycetota bacterium]